MSLDFEYTSQLPPPIPLPSETIPVDFNFNGMGMPMGMGMNMGMPMGIGMNMGMGMGMNMGMGGVHPPGGLMMDLDSLLQQKLEGVAAWSVAELEDGNDAKMEMLDEMNDDGMRQEDADEDDEEEEEEEEEDEEEWELWEISKRGFLELWGSDEYVC
jgi:hypothetical protein